MYSSRTFGDFCYVGELKRGFSKKVIERKAPTRSVIGKFDLSMPPLVPRTRGDGISFPPIPKRDILVPRCHCEECLQARRGNPLECQEEPQGRERAHSGAPPQGHGGLLPRFEDSLLAVTTGKNQSWRFVSRGRV